MTSQALPPTCALDVVHRFELDAGALLPGVLALADRGVEHAELEACRLVQAAIGRLASVEPSRLLADLEALLVHPRAVLGLRWLESFGVLPLLLPEVAALIGFHASSPRPHKDLWDHTLKVLERVSPEADLRWVALAHDIGKIATRAVLPDGRLAFHRHEAVGARLFVGIGARLGMPLERVHRIAFVIEHHARTNQFESGWSDRALRRMMRECGAHLPLMLAFSAADWTTKQKARAERILGQQALLARRLAELRAEELAPKLPVGTSEALMAQTDLGPGPWLAQARRWLLAGLADGAIPAETTAEALAARWCAELHADDGPGPWRGQDAQKV